MQASPIWQQDESNNEDALPIQDYIAIVRSRLPLVFLCVALCLLFGVYLVFVSPRIFQATATVQIASDHRTVMAVQDLQTEDLKSREILYTIEHKIHRPSLIAKVLESADVRTHPDLVPPPVRWLPPFSQESGEESDSPPPTEEELREMMSGWISVTLRRNTRLIDINVEHPNPKVAQLIANRLVETFNQENADQKTTGIKEAIQFLREEKQQASDELQRTENFMQLYENASSLMEDIRIQEKSVRTLEQRYREMHPKLIQARRLYREVGEQFLMEYTKAKEAETGLAFELGEDAEQSLDVRLERALAEFETRASMLERDLKANRELYAALMKRLKEMDMTQELVASEVSLIEPASLPRLPVKPRRTIILALSVLLGGAMGLMFILMLHLIDDKYRSVEDLERQTGIRVLAALMKDRELLRSRNKDAKKGSLPQYAEDPQSQVAEVFRGLRAGLSLIGRDESAKTIMLTSALAGEGKSTVCANLAAAFAGHREKTLLVDFDIRRPTIRSQFGLSADQPGLADHLTNEKPLEDCIVKTGYENLDVLTTGSGSHVDALQYIQEKTIDRVFEELKPHYDRILIDSAPILLVSEGLFMASHADFVCFVVQAGITPKRALRRSLQLMQSVGVTPAGFILNRLKRIKKGAGYYGYEYGYGYGKKSR